MLLNFLFSTSYLYIQLDLSCHGDCFLQIVGLSVVVILFALMRQARAWDLNLPIPSTLTAAESNLRIPLPFLCLGIAPILLSLLISFLMSQPRPLFASFTLVSVICYLLANGFVILLIFISQLLFYVAAIVHIFIKTRFVMSHYWLLLCAIKFGDNVHTN